MNFFSFCEGSSRSYLCRHHIKHAITVVAPSEHVGVVTQGFDVGGGGGCLNFAFLEMFHLFVWYFDVDFMGDVWALVMDHIHSL